MSCNMLNDETMLDIAESQETENEKSEKIEDEWRISATSRKSLITTHQR